MYLAKLGNCVMLLVYCILLCTQHIAGNVLSINSESNALVVDYTSVVMDNDLLKVSFSLKEQVSSGYTFALTPSHNDIVSITDKHCKTESGDEVLVIKKRDGYYSLTTVKKMNDIECSFNIRTFFVINNPTYKLTLTSPLYAPLTADWTEDMYQGDLEVKIIPSNNGDLPTTYAPTSKLVINLDTKSKSSVKIMIPLRFTLTNPIGHLFSLLSSKSILDVNTFSFFFGSCIDISSKNDIIKFHVQNLSNLSPHKPYTFEPYHILVLAEVLDTPFTQSITKFNCEADFRHLMITEIRVDLVNDHLTQVSLKNDDNDNNTASFKSHEIEVNIKENSELNKRTTDTTMNTTSTSTNVQTTSTVTDTTSTSTNVQTTSIVTDTTSSLFSPSIPSSYSSLLGRLRMTQYMVDLINLPLYTTAELRLCGQGLLSYIYLGMGGQNPLCVIIKGMKSTQSEETEIQNGTFRDNDPSGKFSGYYNRVKDEWKVMKNNDHEETYTLMLYTTTTSNHLDISWASCDGVDLDLPNYDSNLIYHPVFMQNVPSLPNIIGKSDIIIKTPLDMSPFDPITIELEHVIDMKNVIYIDSPYIMEKSNLFSICKSYSTTDRNAIQNQPEEYFNKYVNLNIYLASLGQISMSMNTNNDQPLIVCKLYGEFSIRPNTNPADFSGENAKIKLGIINLNLDPDNVIFHPIIIPTELNIKSELTRDVDIETNNISTFSTLQQSTIHHSDSNVNILANTNTGTPSITFEKGYVNKDFSYFVHFKNIPVSVIGKNPENNTIVDKYVFNLIYSIEYDYSTPFFDQVFLKVNGEKAVKMSISKQEYNEEEKTHFLHFTVINHPDVLGSNNRIVTLDFSLYFLNKNDQSYSLMSNKKVSLREVNHDIIAETLFTQYVSASISTNIKPGKRPYVIDRDELMNQYLTNPQELDYASLNITTKTKYPLKTVKMAFYERYDNFVSLGFLDFITDINVYMETSSGIEQLKSQINNYSGTITITLFNDIIEYEERRNIVISITTLANLPVFTFSFEDVFGLHTTLNPRSGVTGVASVVSIPQLITQDYTLDTGNTNYKYDIVPQPRLSVTISDIWSHHYFSQYDLTVPSNNFNIFKWNNIRSNEILSFSEVEKHIPFTSIPTNDNIKVEVTYSIPDRDLISHTFTPRVFVPDMSLITEIIRVDSTNTPITDMTISPDSDHIAFAFVGRVFSPVTTLTINTHQIPIKMTRCSQDGENRVTIDIETNMPKTNILRDLTDLDPFTYEHFTVICEFTHLSTSELREGRYTGVLTATLDSPTLGKSTVTSVTEGFTVTVPRVNVTDNVTINSLVTVKDTPSTGLTPNEIEHMLDQYKKAKDTITGKTGVEVGLDNMYTYPVDNGKYDTDVDIVITAPQTDSQDSISLDDVRVINDKFISDISNENTTWNVSVSPPTYGVEVDECKNKCGVGCRLCGNDVTCKVDADCLFNHCDTETRKCSVKPGEDIDNGNNNVVSLTTKLSTIVVLITCIYSLF